ncbi:MAG: sigma-70 family RNA polymerase sigma factor [Myxococcota bacterium]
MAVDLSSHELTLGGRSQTQTDEHALLERARSGDRRAFDLLVRREAPRVERLLRRLLGNRDDFDDLLQTVFVELCKALPKFRGESSLSTFVGGITVRVANRAMRKSAFFRYRADASAGESYISAAPDPASETAAKRQLEHTRRVLDQIKPKKRTAFILWALEGMAIDEIADLTGASVAATRSRIFHAQKELRSKAARDPHLAELVGAP